MLSSVLNSCPFRCKSASKPSRRAALEKLIGRGWKEAITRLTKYYSCLPVNGYESAKPDSDSSKANIVEDINQHKNGQPRVQLAK